MTGDELGAMIREADGCWADMSIWTDYMDEPPIAHKALSMALMLLTEEQPLFAHLRAKPDAPDFKVTIFTHKQIVTIEYDGTSLYPVGRTISRRSIQRLDLLSANVTTVMQTGSARQPLTYLVGYPDFSLTLTTEGVRTPQRRAAIESLFPTLQQDWQTRGLEHMF